ncbi:MAG: peptidoglycan editing factor PgeF [Candidatus Gottesmanbacteria bacterium]|nr:peptidoglycan editing factor PgeF [Candidatus Gottesmanbacteria bacterium]
MLTKINGIGFQSTLLSPLDGIIHGFSNRLAGDMENSKENRDTFASRLGLRDSPILPEQVHDNRIQTIDKKSIGIVSGVDGLVSRDTSVAVLAADCAAVLLVDPVAKICAAVHAGWKGTLGGVIGNAVGEMVRIGAEAQRIRVALGPHIGLCCYDVPEDRIGMFEDRFGRDEKMVAKIDGRWHLDIGWANYRLLIEAGLHPDHIDAPPTCTSCQSDTFFSYRKDSKETYGEMMAVIGFQI